MATKLIFLDCDSTLSSLEGIDELARLRGGQTFEACANMTNRAMNGEIEIEAVYGERLKLIEPSRKECLEIGQRYIETIEPHVRELVAWLNENGWTPVILSGGLTQVIEPLGLELGIDGIKAVDLEFNEDGSYKRFVSECPTSRMGGKIEVIEEMKAEAKAETTVMVGDGVSDLETKPVVDLFIGYGRVVARDKVKAGAEVFVNSLDSIPEILSQKFG
ncbi:HAD-IB family phosphatase [Puniceicoccaceae bacterium K14]|nr:HAD-IB family phosphatase [Puniceicoccaceae bacterium K14]